MNVWNSHGIRWEQNGARARVGLYAHWVGLNHIHTCAVATHINPFNNKIRNCMHQCVVFGLWDIGLCACHTRLVFRMGRMWRGIISCEEHIYIYVRNELTSRAHGQHTMHTRNARMQMKWNGWKNPTIFYIDSIHKQNWRQMKARRSEKNGIQYIYV